MSRLTSKINISLPIEEPTLKQIIDANKKLTQVDSNFNWITFSLGGTSKPHMTISMGIVDADCSIERVIDTCVKMAQSCPEKFMEMSFGDPFVEKVTGRYVLLPVILGDAWFEWRSIFRVKLNEHFVSSSRTSDAPHVTLASYDSSVSDELVVTGEFENCLVDCIDIAEGGNKGAKGNILAAIRMQSGEILYNS